MRETWESLIRDFVRHHERANRALNTQTIYRGAAVGLIDTWSRTADGRATADDPVAPRGLHCVGASPAAATH